MALLREMLRKQGARTLALAGWAVWSCALPTNNAPPTAGSAGAGGTSGGGGTGNTAAGMTGGTSTGGTAAGMTGGTVTGGTAGSTGGTVTGGTAGSTGGTVTGGTAGSSTGGTLGGAGTGTGGTAGSMAGAGTGGSMGGAGSGGKGGTAGTGGSMGGAGSGGKGGSAGTPGVLVHRYSFTGTNTTATDSVGTAHGTLMNGATQSGGVLNLSGGTSDQYVSLPTDVLNGLGNATFEVWTSWTGGTSNWQRIFDFGSNDVGGGQQGTSNASAPYFFLTPRAQATSASGSCTTTTASLMRVALTSGGPAQESCVVDGPAFPTGMTHVAVVINGSMMSLYLNGASIGTPVALSASLANVSGYEQNWLGRSQFASDTEYAGTISEFRIYPTARSATQISSSASAGPDSVPAQ